MRFKKSICYFLVALFLTISIGHSKSNVDDSVLKVFLGNLKSAPYEIGTPGNILANFNRLVLGSLIERDSNYNLREGILKEFRYDFDKDLYLLRLQPNVKFHNGRRVDSKDLEFSILRGFFSARKNYFSIYLGGIKGVGKIKSGSKFQPGTVSGVKVIDERTVAVKLKSPNPSFLHSLTGSYFSVVPREALREDYFTWKKYPVGAGRYKVEKKFDGTKTVLKKVNSSKENYKIELYSSLVKDQKIDISFEPLKNFRLFALSSPGAIRVLQFSNKNKYGQKAFFRKRVCSILKKINFDNGKGLIKNVHSILPNHFWGKTTSPDSFKYEELGKDLPAIEEKLEFIVFSKGDLSERQKYYVDKMKKAFLENGIDVTFKTNNEKFVKKTTAERFPVRVVTNIVNYTDPLILYSNYKYNGENSFYSLSGEEAEVYNKLYFLAENSQNFEKKISNIIEMAKYAEEKALYCPLADEKVAFFYNQKTIADMGVQFDSLTLDFERIVKN